LITTSIAGTIRESGGAFGKREAAMEEQYFRKVQTAQLQHLKELHENEIDFHQKEIARHQVRRPTAFQREFHPGAEFLPQGGKL
jgi:hypothetical protein